MDKFNDFFVRIAEKIPFAKDFFKSNLSVLGIEISNLFLVIISFLLVISALILTIVLIVSNQKEKKKKAAEVDSVNADEFLLDTQIIEEPLTAQDSGEIIESEKQLKQKEVSSEQEEPHAAVDDAKDELFEESSQQLDKDESKQDESVEDTDSTILATYATPEEEQIVVASDATVAIEESAENTVVIDYAAESPSDTQPQKEADMRYAGKYEINITSCGYRFYLIASNGQLLYESNGYTSVEGAVKGIDTFKNAVVTGSFIIDEDKFGRFRFVLNKRYVGENYNTKASCENSIGSVKKFSQTATLIPYIKDAEKEKAYEENLEAQKNQKEPDWEAIEKEEALTKPSGKFEITKNDNGFRFVLLANNGQLLYSSNGYASNKSALAGINTFKRTVYSGKFFIDKDKFGRYRYILRGASFMTVYTGESYTTKVACEKIVESVKKFVKSAVLPE